MKGSRRVRRALIAGVLCVAVAAVASVAWATTSADDKFVACANKKSGVLRLVTAAKDCRKAERSVTWNVAGPRGLRGPVGLPGTDGLDGDDGDDGRNGFDGDDGDDGDDGPAGPQGPASEPKWRYVHTVPTAIGGPGTLVLLPTCPPTAPNAVNGGYDAPLPAGVSVTGSAPVIAPAAFTTNQWQVEFANVGVPTEVTAWVLCASGGTAS